jgi:formylglycine-generating enzyme required for sulfatase activity
MSLLNPLIAFTLRQAIAEPDDRVADFLTSRLGQAAESLPAAVAYAADHTWRGLAAALALDGVLSRLRTTDPVEAAGVQEQLRRFSDLAAARFGNLSEEVRMAGLAEWRGAQVEGRAQHEKLDLAKLVRLLRGRCRYEDPAELTAAAGRAEEVVAAAVAVHHPRLGEMLAEQAGDPPVLASIFAYFFRREIESNEELSCELFCDGLRHFSGRHVRALTGLAQALERLGSRFDVAIDQMLAGAPATQSAPVRLAPIHASQAEKLGRRRGLSGVLILPGPVEADAPPAPPLRKVEPRRPGDALVNALGMRFVWIPPGRFSMGSAPQEPSRDEDEKHHEVRLTHGFFLGAHPVTRGQFASFVRATRYVTEAEGGGLHRGPSAEWKLDPWCNWRHPGFAQDDDHPVACVSWNDAQAFCAWLAGEKNSLKGICRLPTEAEWEWACRAGTTTAYGCGEKLSPAQANYNVPDVPREGTTPVWSFPPNPWGLHDMHGNLWEWCRDWYGPYQEKEVEDPRGPSSGRLRLLRGGSWRSQDRFLRSAARNQLAPSGRDRDAGFRVCLFL